MTRFKDLPFVCKALIYVRARYRLMLEYAMIASILILGAVSSTLWVSKEDMEMQLEKVATRLVQVEDWREADLERIRVLMDKRARDSESLQMVIEKIRSLGNYSDEINERLHELEQSNQTVREYLEQRYQGSMQCLLDESCEKE